MNLAAKLVLLFLVCLSLVVAVFSYLSIQQAEQLVQAEHERHAIDLAATLESSLGDMGPRAMADVENVLTLWSRSVQHVRVRLVNPDWDVARFRPTVPVEVISSRTEIQTFRYPAPTGELCLYTYVPLQDESGMRLEVAGQPDRWGNRLSDTLGRSALALLAASVISSIAILVGGIWMVGRPLENLLAKVRKIGHGDLSSPIELRRSDELGKLGTAINEMCTQLQDQRERIEAETQEKIAAVKSLRHADRLRTVGRLAAGLAHEIGTPLNVVSGRAELIAGGQLPPEGVVSSALAIKTESQRIAGIVRQLLDFARPAAAHRSLADLVELSSRVVELMRPLAHKHGVSLVWAPPSVPLLAHFDAGQIQQVLTNLIVNALHACAESSEREREIAIKVSTEKMDCSSSEKSERVYHRISIRDNGHGIEPDVIENLFEPFFTTKDVGEGTGLGLAIAYGIVQEHNGRIDVSSQPEVGTEFAVYLPVHPDSETSLLQGTLDS
ncbi:MAG: ATP-binding protein [Pirellulaceae bacterium]